MGSIRVTEFVDREEDRKEGDRVCRQRGGGSRTVTLFVDRVEDEDRG